MTHTRTDGKQQVVTPGPWGIDRPYQEDGLYIQAKDTSLVCKVYDDGDEYHMANARLIAAAPALYDLVARMVYMYDGGDKPSLEERDHWMDEAHTALALVKDTRVRQ